MDCAFACVVGAQATAQFSSIEGVTPMKGKEHLNSLPKRKMNNQRSVQNCGIGLLPIAVFLFAFQLIQTTANAQVAFGKENRVSSVFSGKCLVVEKAVNGERIVQKDCNAGNQPFFFQFAGGESFEIKLKGVGKCLDVQGAATGNGTPVILWDCNGAKNQRWTAHPVGEGYQIRSMQSGKCLDVRGPSKVDGTPIQIWDCGTATTKQMLYKITDMDIIEGGSAAPSSDNAGTGMSLQQITGIVDSTSTIIDQFTDGNAFANGPQSFFGGLDKLSGALKIFGAAAGLFDLILDIAKQDTPSVDEKVLTSLDGVHRKLDGLDARTKREFDELRNFLIGQDAYQRLFKSDNVVDSQYSDWKSNELTLKVEPNTVRPEYKPEMDFRNEASAIGNLCSGESGGKPIYDAVAAANKGNVKVFPKLHLLISSKLSKAQTLGAYQTYRASYLTTLKSMTRKSSLNSTGVENQIAEIEKFEKAAGSKIAFEQLRKQHLESAKKQFANSMAPHWSKCEKAARAAVTKYFDPANVREAAKMVVETEFLRDSRIAQDKLPLLLTDSNPDLYSQGRGFGGQTKIDGSFDPSLAGGRFTAAIGKRLEAAFPGYGFVVVAYAQYDSMPTIRSNVSNRCSAATPMSFGGNEAIVKSDKESLVWRNIPVDGPLRICSGRADQYSFNLIVSGFRRETLAGDTKTWINNTAALTKANVPLYNAVENGRRDSEEYGKSVIAAASNNLKPSVVSVFAALPSFTNGRRADPVYYIYPSKFTDVVSYPSTVSKLFYVVSPIPF